MGFKVGDRIHVTRFRNEEVDFYATLSFMGLYNFLINNCTNKEFNNRLIAMPDSEFFGKYKDSYYTLATDEEDTEEPEVQHVNDKFSFARSKNYEIQEYIQEGNNLNIAKNMKEGCTMPTIKTKKEMNLPQLIEWGFENDIRNARYIANNTEGYLSEVSFEITGLPIFSSMVDKQDTFTVEIEEEITEDTVIPQIIGILRSKYSNSKVSMMHNDKSVNEIIKGNNSNGLHYETLTLHVINDDDTHTLIWRDGKLVE